MSMLPIVDVNVSNVVTTWPLLMKAMSTADFISMDLVGNLIHINAHHI